MWNKVQTFTQLSTQCNNKPTPMTLEQTKFIIGMILSETVELARTVVDPRDKTKSQINKEALQIVRELINTDYNADRDIPSTYVECTAEQTDALIDIVYYVMNAAAKMGVDFESAFNIVHTANMNKRTLNEQGELVFQHRDDGKILKPTGWQPPDVLTEITRQIKCNNH